MNYCCAFSVFLALVFTIYYNNQQFCLYFCLSVFFMIAKIWLAFCLRRSHLLSLGMFYTKTAKSWEGFANFKGHHSFYQYHLEEWQKQQRSNSNNNKKKLVPNNKNVPREDTVSAGQTWDDRWRAVREENITQRKDKCQLETQMMQPYLNFLGN